MKTILNPALLIPIWLLILQALLLMSICLFILRKTNIIRQPMAGMEYSHAIIVAAILVAVFIIQLSAISPTFQAFKTYQNQHIPIFRPLIDKFGQFFIIILCFELLLFLTIYLITRILFGGNKLSEEANSGNIPFSLFICAMIIGFGILFSTMSREIMDYIIPRYLSFQ